MSGDREEGRLSVLINAVRHEAPPRAQAAMRVLADMGDEAAAAVGFLGLSIGGLIGWKRAGRLGGVISGLLGGVGGAAGGWTMASVLAPIYGGISRSLAPPSGNQP